jgi:hypothetical protein
MLRNLLLFDASLFTRERINRFENTPMRDQEFGYVHARCCLQLQFTVEAHQHLTCTS